MNTNEKLTKLADNLTNDIDSVRNKEMNLDQARSIAMLANAVIKAILAAIKSND